MYNYIKEGTNIINLCLPFLEEKMSLVKTEVVVVLFGLSSNQKDVMKFSSKIFKG